ncbi:MAG: hypothetical protein R6W85_08765 [Gillisia sp.]
MIKRFIIIVALLSTVFSAAQEGTSSPYSYYGIGLTKFKGTVENQSMGGMQLFSDSIHLNLRNPAAYGRLKLTTFAVGGSQQRTNLKNDDLSEDSNNTSLDYLAIGVPTGKLNFGFGLIPYSAVGYQIENRTDQTFSRLDGRGGLNKVFLTTGYAITNNLSIGVDANYNFGNIQNKAVVFQEGVALGSRIINRTDLSGFNFNFGVDYQRDLGNNLRLYTAATYAPETNITANRMRDVSTIAFSTDGREQVIPPNVNVNFGDEDLTLPAQFTIGAGLGRPNKWFMGAEYTSLQASAFNFNSGTSPQNSQYRDASQFKAGGYYIPEYNSLSGYFKRVVYRAGARFEETGLYLNNEGINEFGISFGLGLPAGTNFSNVNLGLEYGQRGTTNSGLIKESFFKLSLSLSLNDKWFVQRRFD